MSRSPCSFLVTGTESSSNAMTAALFLDETVSSNLLGFLKGREDHCSLILNFEAHIKTSLLFSDQKPPNKFCSNARQVEAFREKFLRVTEPLTTNPVILLFFGSDPRG